MGKQTIPTIITLAELSGINYTVKRDQDGSYLLEFSEGFLYSKLFITEDQFKSIPRLKDKLIQPSE